MIQAARTRGIRQVMITPNACAAGHMMTVPRQMSACPQTVVYFQFDGLREETYLTIRGEPLLDTKILALDRLADAGMSAVLVAAIERGVNTDEVGAIVEFGLQHPAVRGVVFQPVTHVGRHIPFDPMTRVTIPDIIHGIVDQSDSRFVLEDFVPVPCCFPTCQVNSYIFVDGDTITPLPRLLDIDQYLDYSQPERASPSGRRPR
ncbi:7,8-dihydro-6-hydroxymethylpterin dimethyltransferase [Geodia barretti]|uniref:7,8-dihydro-6-hydroxymethylpterin dimethyltransferase n=1 Tax=Geodia barretti TaxID=519541 RepID=A0AA35SBH5_GEOBA|nr:7,8-dihydro-6-hydroxymethylpterin dimethyltransferase [Geodia barretti]